MILKNPYLEAFNKYVVFTKDHGYPEWRERTGWKREDGFSGPKWDRNLTDTTNTFTARYHLTFHCAYAVPNDEAIQAIAELWLPVVEIGAGNGYWAWMLEQAGVEVLAFDNALDDESNHWCVCDHWTKVYPGDHTILRGIGWDYALMLCWPPYNDSLALDCLQAYRGHTLIYIGEGEGGCCAPDDFFNELDDHWILIREVDIPQWVGLHDYLAIYKRRKYQKVSGSVGYRKVTTKEEMI